MRGRIPAVLLIFLATLCPRPGGAQEISEELRFQWKVSELSWVGNQHDDALRVLIQQPDRALNVLVRELPEWARQNPRRLPGLMIGLKELVPLASPESRAIAMATFAGRQEFSKRVPWGVDEAPRMLAEIVIEALGGEGLEGLGVSLTNRPPHCENPVLALGNLRDRLMSWATRVIRRSEEDRTKRVRAAMLLSCFGSKGVEALRQNKEQSIDLLVEALLDQSHDTEPPRAALILSTLDLQGSADRLATLVEGADVSRRAAALRSLWLLLLADRSRNPPLDITRLTPHLLAEAKSPCGQSFRPAVRLLGAFRTQSAAPVLGDALKHPCAGGALMDVLLALGGTNDHGLIRPLLDTMNDPDKPRPVRERAATILRGMPDNGARSAAGRFLDPWWGRRSTHLLAIVALCLSIGPGWVMLRKRPLTDGGRVAYGWLTFLSGAWTWMPPLEGSRVFIPPLSMLGPVAIYALLTSAIFVAMKKRPSKTPEASTMPEALSAAARLLGKGVLAFVAGFLAPLALLVLAFLGFRHVGP